MHHLQVLVELFDFFEVINVMFSISTWQQRPWAVCVYVRECALRRSGEA